MDKTINEVKEGDLDLDQDFEVAKNIIAEKSRNTNHGKLTLEQWKDIEYIETDKKNLFNVLSKLGNGIDIDYNNNKSAAIISYGDDIYCEKIRPILMKLKYVGEKIPNELIKQEKKNKKVNKKDLIREDIIKNRVSTLLKDFIITTVNNKNLNKIGFISDVMEIRLITFIHVANYYLKKEVEMGVLYELIIGIEKVILNIQDYDNISNVLLYDLKCIINRLKNHCKFRFDRMISKYPKLILSTDHDSIFPLLSIKPYPSQVAVIETIKNNEEILLFYKAVIGCGKTTTVIPLAKLVELQRIAEISKLKKGEKAQLTQLLFVCCVEAVRYQVGRLMYNSQVPFGIATMTDKGLKMSDNHLYCKKPENRVVIISDLQAAVELLKVNKNYILFLDEPTVGADQKNDPVTMEIAKLILLAPNKTILSSATLPKESELVEIIDYFKSIHTNAKIETIYSRESFIGCELSRIDTNEIITPHNDCNSAKELKLIIEKMRETTFIDRLYTGPILYKLCERMRECGYVDNLVDLEKHFSNITNLSQSNIQKLTVDLLVNLANTDNDELIAKICKPLSHDNNKIAEKEEDKQDDNIMWEDEEQVDDTEATIINDFANLFTSNAYKFMGPTLVTVKDPINFAKSIKDSLLKNCKPAKTIICNYLDEIEKYNKELQKLDKIKNEDSLSQQLQEFDKMIKPSLKFPVECIINSPAHINIHSLIDVNAQTGINIDKNLIRSTCVDHYPLDLNISDWMYQLLFAGIGIYMPGNNIAKQYTDFVLKLASEGKLAFLISNYDISYGANYPFSHVIITDDGANEHSINTIFQLLGRAGRVGVSWKAFGYVQKDTWSRILEYIKGNNNDASVEAENIRETFKKLIESIKEKERLAEIERIRKEKEPPKKTIKISEVQNNNGWQRGSALSQYSQHTEPSQSSQFSQFSSQSTNRQENTNDSRNTRRPSGNRFNDRSHGIGIHQGDRSDNKSNDRPYSRFDNKSNNRPDNKSNDRSYSRSDNKPNDRPYTRSDSRSDNKPNDKPYSRSDDKPYDRPYNRSDNKPNDKPNDKPYSRSDVKPYDRPYNRSDNKPNDRPYNRSDNKPNDRPYNRSDDKPYEKPYNKFDDKPYEKPYNRYVDKSNDRTPRPNDKLNDKLNDKSNDKPNDKPKNNDDWQENKFRDWSNVRNK